MKRILLLCLLLLGLASSLRAEDSLKLDFRYENVPEKQQFLGDIVQTRIAERSAGGILALTFRIDAGALDPEEFTLEENGETRTATITAGSFRGLVFGAGAFLRSLDYGVDSFGIPTLSLREKPNLPFRACYFARHFHNWYHMADAAELERYVEDLALWGFNTIAVIMVPCINLDLDPTAQDWKDAVAGAKVIRSSAKRLDLTFVAMGGSNSVTRDMPKELAATPNIDPRRGNNGFNACPSKPGGLEFIDKKTRAVCGSFAGELADYICFWPFDEGGCECEKCGPWATNGYLKISAHNTEMIRDEFAPDVRFILSTWTYHEDEFETTWEWVKDHPEIEYVLADSHTDFPRYPLEHPLP
ncbi:MAG: hypothetical protein IKW74_03270, partial [Thermoguttaceae bacterium]|nr:hypothetical protein [Thermoguttaceae bacterium]